MSEEDDFWPGLSQAIRARIKAPYCIIVLPPTLDPEEQVQMLYGGGMNKDLLLWALERVTKAVKADAPFEKLKID